MTNNYDALSSSTGDLPIEIAQDTFPIVGTYDLDLKQVIEEERRVARHDLSDSFVMVSVSYNDPFPYDLEEAPPEKIMEIRRIVVSRDQDKIVFNAIGEIRRSTRSGYYEFEAEMVCATASIRVAQFLRIARAYLEHRRESEQVMRDYRAVGNKSGMEKLDEHGKLLHLDLALMIENSLEAQPIRFCPPSSADESDSATMTRLTTALLMHVLPASTFGSGSFLTERVKPKYDLRSFRRSDFEKPAGYET